MAGSTMKPQDSKWQETLAVYEPTVINGTQKRLRNSGGAGVLLTAHQLALNLTYRHPPPCEEHMPTLTCFGQLHKSSGQQVDPQRNG